MARISSVTYALAWDTSGTTPLPGEAGWAVTTDLGYRVEVTRGYLTSYSLFLGSCPEASLQVWPSLGLVGTAHAGHSVLGDASTLLTPWVESLTAPQDTTLAPVTFPEARYCEASYLVARADGKTLNLPQDAELKNVSLLLEGRYLAPGAAAPTPFSYKTTLSHGANAEISLTGEGSSARITAHRRLAHLFDGIDLSTESEGRVLRAVLARLIEDTTFSAALEP